MTAANKEVRTFLSPYLKSCLLGLTLIPMLLGCQGRSEVNRTTTIHSLSPIDGNALSLNLLVESKVWHRGSRWSHQDQVIEDDEYFLVSAIGTVVDGKVVYRPMGVTALPRTTGKNEALVKATYCQMSDGGVLRIGAVGDGGKPKELTIERLTPRSFERTKILSAKAFPLGSVAQFDYLIDRNTDRLLAYDGTDFAVYDTKTLSKIPLPHQGNLARVVRDWGLDFPLKAINAREWRLVPLHGMEVDSLRKSGKGNDVGLAKVVPDGLVYFDIVKFSFKSLDDSAGWFWLDLDEANGRPLALLGRKDGDSTAIRIVGEAAIQETSLQNGQRPEKVFWDIGHGVVFFSSSAGLIEDGLRVWDYRQKKVFEGRFDLNELNSKLGNVANAK